MDYLFGSEDQVVLRQDDTGAERWGKITLVRGNGDAEVFLPKGRGFYVDSWLLIKPSGFTMMRMFRVIKHITKAEFEATAEIINGAKQDGVLRK